MKKVILFLLISILQSAVYSQITCVPQYPTTDSAVTIYFDATGTGLEGYTGDVYAHTGIKYPGNNTWQLVIGTWGNNATQPKLTRTAYNKYKLDINPSIRAFYSIPSNQIADYLCFVFRSADGSKQTSDLFYKVQKPGATFIENDSNQIYALGDSVPITVVAIGADSIVLFVADTIYFKAYSSILKTKIKATSVGKNTFYVKTYIDGQSTTTYSSYFVRKNTLIAPLPTGTIPGINYNSETSVTLALYAPYKQFVFVVGDFNNWQVDLDYQMNISPDTPIFWITINNLTPSVEYAFQYYIDGQVYIADPYADKILDPWNDKYISNATYPNLKPYPTRASGIVSILQTAQQPYQWKITNFNRPAVEDLVIYELLVRDFVAAHDFKTLIDTLKYLKKLGINAIELMPINEFEGNESWGYNPMMYFAVDKYYGHKNKFKEFVDSCHANGIAVIIDMVLNHSFGLSPLVRMYYNNQTNQVSSQNPWYNVTSPNTVYYWGYDFNHQSPATKYFCNRVLQYWLTEYNIDGYRMDFTKGFTNTSGDGWAYDQQRINILKQYYDVIQQTKPGSYFILEHLTDNSEETVLANYGMLLWGNLNYAYCQASMGYSQGSNFNSVSYKVRGWTKPHLVGYMESHDEERMMFKNIKYGNFSGSYNIKNLSTALERAKLSTLFFLTIPGPKMIWQFGELGYDVSIDDPCRVCNKPIKWEYFADADRRKLYNFYADLLRLRKKYNIFRTKFFAIDAAGSVKTITLLSDTMNILIVGNFDVIKQQKDIEFPSQGTYYEYFKKSKIDTQGTLTIDLEPGEYHLYSTKKIFDDPIDEISENTFIYPNPVNNVLNIYNIPQCEKIIICSLNGGLIKSIETPKSKIENIDISHLNRGLYIVHFVGLDKKQSKKFIKM